MSATDNQSQSRKTPRKTRKREQEVVDAAARIFYERGYADATVQDVADALGILKGSLYYYIDVKEDLLFRLVDEVHDEVDDLLNKVLAQKELPAIELLSRYIRQQVVYNLRNLVKITVYYHDIDQLSDERRKTIVSRRREHQDLVTGLIRQAQADGTADPSADPRLLANCVFGTIIWTYRWYRPRDEFRIDDVAETCVRYAIGGIRGPLTPNGRPRGTRAAPSARRPAAAS